MANREIKNKVDGTTSIAPASYSSDATGSSVDLQDVDAASVHFQCGAIAGNTHTPKVQESADGLTNWSDVAATDLEGSLTAFTASSDQRVGYRGSKRFIRAYVTSGGASAIYSAQVVRGYPKYGPLA